nr:MAG TPA: hypothetical protein [Bacteriophage sp.]
MGIPPHCYGGEGDFFYPFCILSESFLYTSPQLLHYMIEL